VVVEWDVRSAVVDAREAMVQGAPSLEACVGNLALTCGLATKPRRITLSSRQRMWCAEGWAQRERRTDGAALGPRRAMPRRTLHLAHDHRSRRRADARRLASILGVPLECRCVFGDMGGNFGTATPSIRIRPAAVGCAPDRAASAGPRRGWCFMTDYQARDLASQAELALDEAGNFLALRGANVMNLGAQTVYFWPLRKGLSMMQSVYRIPAVHFHGHAVLTHTTPTAVYRSAGRPEAVFVIERLIDIAAETLGFDRVELRRAT
jgi:carbon-monoxide dehydrogenase large subunit